MMAGEKKIIVENGNDGEIIFRLGKTDDDRSSTESIANIFNLTMEKFKMLLDRLGQDEDGLYFGTVLGPMVKDAERELGEIAGVIEKTVGNISIIYEQDNRYGNFRDVSVAGLVWYPTGKENQRVTT